MKQSTTSLESFGGKGRQYFVTIGRGLEHEASSELSDKLSAGEILSLTGKIFFSLPPNEDDQLPISSLMALKSVERLFVLVTAQPPPAAYGIDALLSQILEGPDWPSCVNKWKILTSLESECQLLFRVSCKIASSFSRRLNSQDVSKALGVALSKKFGWTAELRNYNMEVFVHLNDQHLVVGIPVGKVPLSKRTYFASFGLRPPVAWCMAKLANIRPGDRVLDPMCGAGTLMVEAATDWPLAEYIAGDIDKEQLNIATQNISTAQLTPLVSALLLDATRLPFKNNTIDVVLSDIPFGRQQDFGGEAGILNLYRKVLKEMKRVLRQDGVAILLTSKMGLMDNLLPSLTKEGNPPHAFVVDGKRPVALGSLEACIYVLKKSANPEWKTELGSKEQKSRKRKALDGFAKSKKRKEKEKPKDKEEKQSKEKKKKQKVKKVDKATQQMMIQQLYFAQKRTNN